MKLLLDECVVRDLKKDLVGQSSSRQFHVRHAAEDDALATRYAARVDLGIEDGARVGDHG
jgi:hypothetical protein